MRPEGAVYTPVDLCTGAKGRLFIAPNGSVSVETLGDFSDAQCFTSLEGASYAVPEPAGSTALISGLLMLMGVRARRAGRKPRA